MHIPETHDVPVALHKILAEPGVDVMYVRSAEHQAVL
jgi:hypothetical protein